MRTRKQVGKGPKTCSDVRSVEKSRALLECRSRFALLLCTVLQVMNMSMMWHEAGGWM
jgi:hypothetical protein